MPLWREHGWLVTRLFVRAALPTTVLACGDPATTKRAAPTTTQTPATTATAIRGGSGWSPGGDCECSDGSEFSFRVREANPKKVVVYLEDGGACFSGEKCAPDSGVYQTRVSEGPTGEGGSFDLADERDPFADYSVTYVPYCTGDVHVGNTTTQYTPGLTVHEKGYVNGTALDRVPETFPGATDVAVIGESAGSIAAPLYGGLVSDRACNARVRPWRTPQARSTPRPG